MEFNEKLQELRKRKGLTQEGLAKDLHVSRTAISKWESGRGYPGIDLLKELARYFGVTLDEMFSGEELLSAAQADSRQRERRVRDLVYGLLDCGMGTFLFLPVFGQLMNGQIQAVSLLALTDIAPYSKTIYLVLILALTLLGIITLALQNCSASLWVRSKEGLSLGISGTAALLFMASTQPYAAIFTSLFLAIKTLMIMKWR